MSKSIDLDIVCQACDGTGLYVGMAERDGAAVVCSRCTGSGKYAYHFEYTPFEQRAATPSSVTRVHVGRGYVLSPQHPACNGGVPANEYTPGMIVPADEQLYCPYLYTHQDWCAQPEVLYEGCCPSAPVVIGSRISECKHWESKAECWRLFHANAPESARREVS